MKEKIKEFVITKGWLMVLTGIATFFLTTIAFPFAFGILIALFVAQSFLYTKWS